MRTVPRKSRCCESWIEFPGARIEDIESLEIVADLLLTNGGGWRKRVDKDLGFPPGTIR